jgi:hypothetical protein
MGESVEQGVIRQASLTTMYSDARGVPFLAGGAPRAHGSGAHELASALRTDIGPFEVVPGIRIPGATTPGSRQPAPDVCLPHRTASTLGFVLRNRVPLLFVRNRNGELIGDGGTALAYALSRPRDFSDELEAIRVAAPAVLVPEAERRHVPRDVVSYITQPYHSFTEGFYGIPTGVFAVSPPGIGLWLGPLVNRPGPLTVRAGVVETDWHRREVFLVAEAPAFTGNSLLVPAGSSIAQTWFVAYGQARAVHIHHEDGPPPEGISYDQEWRGTTAQLAAERRGIAAVNTGVRTVSLECVHCRISLPDAADHPDPAHAWTDLFVPTYKTLRRTHSKVAR